MKLGPAAAAAASAIEVVGAIRAHRFNVTSEDDLQRGIAAALDARGIAHEREVRLTPRDRIDFMVGTLGIEVKIGGGISALTRQLLRYAQADDVAGLVLVTSRMQLGLQLPRELNGKLLTVVPILGGIS